MKQFILTATLVLSLCAAAFAQNNPFAETMEFELTPTAPPTPALKYQLLFYDAFDRLPGNAAILYLDSVLLMGPDAKDKAEKALEAYDAKNIVRFNSFADAIENASVIQELTLAGRRENCDWEAPYHEMGLGTLLPHLSPLRTLARILKVRALREIGQGKLDDALNTIRLGYEMADKVGREPFLVSGLVSLSITSMMDDCLKQLMNRPDAPNLYWALSEFPSRRSILEISLNGESHSWISAAPNLADAWAGKDLSAEQWRSVFDYLGNTIETANSGGSKAMMGINSDMEHQAREQYAIAHHVTPEQAGTVDPVIVFGGFYLQQYQIMRDEMFKLRGLAYPVQLIKSKLYSDHLTKLMLEQPGNLFLQTLSSFQKPVWDFARIDRQLAALTAVEAIRSYAAANNGELPAQLSDITETPVPLNPATGEIFEYRVDNGTATLSDSKSGGPLTYTIRIRK